MATKSPLTPIFAAVDSLGGYNYASLDLVSDRNNLRKLLRWATGVAGEKDFRIDVERAGKTCLFTKREDKDSEYVVGFKGFGHEYEKAATRLAGGCEKATGHHRIVSIVRQIISLTRPLSGKVDSSFCSFVQDFGGLKILLRFEVDACTGSIDVDELTSSFSRLATAATASTAKSPSPPTPVSGISCLETNPRKLVPQSSLIELKTRAAHRELDWHEAYPQLYLSQTAYLYLAKHQKGSFVTVEKVELGGAGMRRYASEAEAGMGKLREVLKEVLEAVRKEGHGVPLSLVCQGGRLALHKRQAGTGKVVGNEILSRFG
jgi:hypothetical protein